MKTAVSACSGALYARPIHGWRRLPLNEPTRPRIRAPMPSDQRNRNSSPTACRQAQAGAASAVSGSVERCAIAPQEAGSVRCRISMPTRGKSWSRARDPTTAVSASHIPAADLAPLQSQQASQHKRTASKARGPISFFVVVPPVRFKPGSEKVPSCGTRTGRAASS